MLTSRMFIAPAPLFPLLLCKPRLCLHHSSLPPAELHGYDACALPAFRRGDARRHATFAKPRRFNTYKKLYRKPLQISTYDLLDFKCRRISTCRKKVGGVPHLRREVSRSRAGWLNAQATSVFASRGCAGMVLMLLFSACPEDVWQDEGAFPEPQKRASPAAAASGPLIRGAVHEIVV